MRRAARFLVEAKQSCELANLRTLHTLPPMAANKVRRQSDAFIERVDLGPRPARAVRHTEPQNPVTNLGFGDLGGQT